MLLDRCALQEPKADQDGFNSHILLYGIFLVYISAWRAKAVSIPTKVCSSVSQSFLEN